MHVLKKEHTTTNKYLLFSQLLRKHITTNIYDFHNFDIIINANYIIINFDNKFNGPLKWPIS